MPSSPQGQTPPAEEPYAKMQRLLLEAQRLVEELARTIEQTSQAIDASREARREREDKRAAE